MTKYRIDCRSFANASAEFLGDWYTAVRSGKEDIVSVERIDESTIEIVTEVKQE